MGTRRKMKNTKAEQTKLMQDRAALVRAALETGKFLTKSDISKATGLNLVQLKNLFQQDRNLYAEYVVIRRTITDIAADNIVAIINNPQHPQHFPASKYILQNFKSDFDETLDGAENVLSIEAGGKTKDPVKIVFSTGKKD